MLHRYEHMLQNAEHILQFPPLTRRIPKNVPIYSLLDTTSI